MKQLITAALSLLSFCTNAADTTDVYAPAIIDKPGNYRLHKGGNGLVAAYQVYGAANNVTLTGEAESVDDQSAVFIYDYVRVNAIRLRTTARSTGRNVQAGHSLNWNKPRGGSVVHCEFLGNDGLIVQQTDEYVRDSITIAYNTGSGITKVKPDGTEGPNHCHFIHVVGVKRSPLIDIYGNRYIGKPGESIEDIVNISGSDNVRFRNNLLGGAYKYPITSSERYTGSGFMFEEDCTNCEAFGNVVFDCMNTLWGISMQPGTRNISIHDNYGVSTGIPRGATAYSSEPYWAGWAAWLNGAIDTTGKSIRIYRNWEAYISRRNLSHFWPRPGRHDENNVNVNGVRVVSQNIIPAGLNSPLPYDPVQGTMDTMIKRWDDSIQRAGGWVGVAAPAAGIPTVELSDSVIKLGTTTVYLTAGYDDAGADAELTGVTYRTNATTIATVVRDSTNILQFRLTGLKLGSFVLTVTFTNAAGETYSKDFPMTVILGKPRATTVKVRAKL